MSHYSAEAIASSGLRHQVGRRDRLLDRPHEAFGVVIRVRRAYGVRTTWTPAPQHPILVHQIPEGIALSTVQQPARTSRNS